MKERFLYKQGDLVTVPTKIAILGGNSVAGRALEALLQGVGYDTRLIEDPPERSAEQLLDGVRLLLLALPWAQSRGRLCSWRWAARSRRRIYRCSRYPRASRKPWPKGLTLYHRPAGWKT